MAKAPKSKSAPAGLVSQSNDKLSRTDWIAIALSLFWLLAAIVFFFTLGGINLETGDSVGSALRALMVLMAVFMPIAMIWVATTAAKTTTAIRDENEKLRVSINAIRDAYVERSSGADIAAIEKKLESMLTAQKQTDSSITALLSNRERPVIKPPEPEPNTSAPENQAPLPLGTPAEALDPPLAIDDLIRALNFPETTDDEEGFDALRKALKDRQAGQLIQAAQDVLTLLSQDGIYMDDLRPDRARPEIWRRFANGERGRVIASLGGVRDRSSLALSAGRMKQDPIFRDAAHHFLRRFDHMFAEFEKSASDAEITGLSDTRTARAFMLLGRVAGIFD